MGIKITGFDKVQRKLQDIQKRGQELAGETNVSFYELFPETFMLKYTKFKTIEEMFRSSGFKIETAEDFNNIPEEDMNSFVSKNTKFSSWEEMRNKAVERWTAKKLGL